MIRDLLKGNWNYDGVVVSDWGSIGEMINHGYSEDLKQSALRAITAGSDIDMESQAYINHLEVLVQENPAIENLIDDAVKRVLLLKYKLGLFDDPYKYSNEDRESKIVNSDANLKLAEEAALKSIVLLKNDNHFLPVNKDDKIAVIGPLADDNDSPLGNWRAKGISNSAVSLLQGIKNIFGKSNVSYAKGCELSIGNNNFFEELTINNSDTSGFHEAIELARNSNIVVIVSNRSQRLRHETATKIFKRKRRPMEKL